jgi:hypothetical protein
MIVDLFLTIWVLLAHDENVIRFGMFQTTHFAFLPHAEFTDVRGFETTQLALMEIAQGVNQTFGQT